MNGVLNFVKHHVPGGSAWSWGQGHKMINFDVMKKCLSSAMCIKNMNVIDSILQAVLKSSDRKID